jgi:hypothetical protein
MQGGLMDIQMATFDEETTEADLFQALSRGNNVAIAPAPENHTCIAVGDPGIAMQLLGGIPACCFKKATHKGTVSWLSAPISPQEMRSAMAAL